MIELLAELGIFIAKAMVIVIAIVTVIGVIVGSRTSRKESSGTIHITNISTKLEQQYQELMANLLDKKNFKLWKKEQKKQKAEKANVHKGKQKDKLKNKQNSKKKQTITKQIEPSHPRVFVLDFVGDIKASQAKNLAREITAVVQLANGRDEVVLRMESAGGMVHGYGLASSQLYRLKEHNINLTVCVDKVAASGGYMMASMASKIVAAPFAVIGSIGVVAQIPNFSKLLKNWKIDFEQHTSGKYKRTLTMLGENTQDGRKKFRQELDNTHKLFKEMIKDNRPAVNINKVATGETWYGQEAVAMKLVDQITTSDEYLYGLSSDKSIYHIKYKEKKSLADRLSLATSSVLDTLLMRWLEKDQEQQLGK